MFDAIMAERIGAWVQTIGAFFTSLAVSLPEDGSKEAIRNTSISLTPRGTKITPGIKALLATFGYAKVVVFKKPRIGIIATGSELLGVDEQLQPGKIHES